MFGVKHHPVPGFQLHFHGSELLGEVAGRSLQQAPCHVHSHLLPGTPCKGNACAQPASDIRHSFVERFLLHRGRDGKPLLPVRVEHGEFHRDDVASVLNRGHQYVEPFALHLCRPRHNGILRHNDISRLHGFEQPEFHRLPVRQGLVLVTYTSEFVGNSFDKLNIMKNQNLYREKA